MMRVLTAMSGGVDSAVTALLLQQSGYTPVGITALMWDGADQRDVQDAAAVCALLGIEHYCIDLRHIFREKVICKFAQEYDRGRTPNPCLDCNKYIKFGELYNLCGQYDCEKFATGHYARVGEYEGQAALFRAADEAKDQSYVLYGLTQQVLGHLLLPLGEYTKGEIRQKAQDRGIRVARKSDSQDICFIPDGDYKQVLKRVGLKHSHSGNFELSDGTKIGKHKGTACYTIGQRKGLGISWEHPLYVVDKNPARNAVVLGQNEDLYRNSLTFTDANFIVPVASEFTCSAKIRYKAKDATCHVQKKGKKWVAEFSEKQRAITPGQAVVFYQGDMVLGGGVIG